MFVCCFVLSLACFWSWIVSSIITVTLPALVFSRLYKRTVFYAHLDMVNKKCVKCNKNVTKKVPGLECSRCNQIVHADPLCSKLSNKQLNTIRNSPGIEWSCEHCLKNISHRSSFVIPDEEDDVDDYETTEIAPVVDAKKLVMDIGREVKKTFREEIRSLENSLDFLSSQLTTMEQSIIKQDSKIKELENKNYDLQNKNKNLELRVNVLEQGLKEFEQQSLGTFLEIAGLPEILSKDMCKVVDTVAHKLNVEQKYIQSSRRLFGTKDKPGPLLVELKSKELVQKWVEAGKAHCLTVGQILPSVQKEKADDRVYIREALTKYQKTLLYNTKSELLNKSCEYVWSKNGKVFARKSNNSKIYYIRTLNDIKLVKTLCSSHTEKQQERSTPM